MSARLETLDEYQARGGVIHQIPSPGEVEALRRKGKLKAPIGCQEYLTRRYKKRKPS